MIEVVQWTRLHRRAFERWPSEPNVLLPAFLLRSPDEPWDVPVRSAAVLFNGSLVGRFSYRDCGLYAFAGLVLDPAVRGRGLSVPAMRASLSRLSDKGYYSAAVSVALANTASVRMLQRSGFSQVMLDWRVLPPDFDVSLLAGCPTGTVNFASRSLVYARMSVLLADYSLRWPNSRVRAL